MTKISIDIGIVHLNIPSQWRACFGLCLYCAPLHLGPYFIFNKKREIANFSTENYEREHVFLIWSISEEVHSQNRAVFVKQQYQSWMTDAHPKDPSHTNILATVCKTRRTTNLLDSRTTRNLPGKMHHRYT